ncbi:kinesin-like protein KIN-4A isoform X2 [Tasmannia lanceolata]|uniref:kinesin-like protein KIN-4A isoform X2 n=1 Tax=Tasmannia lanceolata TaxID=3420 RepID=UPI0040641A39
MEVASAEDCCIKVAVHIRTLISEEQIQGCKDCVNVVSGKKPQVQIGTHFFTFDHVYGSSGSPSSAMFEECIAPLVDGLFQGYNATVLAYGQTGSGKTYTMGTGGREGVQTGIIPQVMNALFSKIEILKQHTEFQLHVSFIEILKEEVRDLLDPTSMGKSETASGHVVKVTIPGKPPIQIRETSNGVITLAGSTEVDVSTPKEMAACLEQGSLNRATGCTNMNNQSSRSHAIFTITLEQMHKIDAAFPGYSSSIEVMNEDYLCSKLHLVDLAGSERAKRTGSDVLRFKEGVHINKGLLALGNVISALGDEKKRKEGMHVPYRDSKLTRLLQDSLGGNSRTVMIACISPADINVEETLNTLKYANRARNIQNKPIVNRDPISNEIVRMRQQLEYLQAELLCAHGGSSSGELQVLKERISWLEVTNEDLSKELNEYRSRYSPIEQFRTDAQDGDICFMKEALKRDSSDGDSSDYQMGENITGSKEIDEVAKEWEHTILQNSMDKELNELNKRLEQKEVLQRKTEEASMATKRLKELLEARKSSACDCPVTTNGNTIGGQSNEKSLQRWLDLELDVMVNVHEVRTEYEKQSQVLGELAEELATLRQEDKLVSNRLGGKNGSSRTSGMSPNTRLTRIASLENMVIISSNALVAMASQLSEAEEQECAFTGRGRWDQLRSMGDAKSLVEYMFNVSADARCQVWEKEIEVKELKEQLNELVGLLRQSEAQRNKIEKQQKVREQVVAIALATSASGNSNGSMKHSDDSNGPLSPMPVPAQTQLKYTPGIANIPARRTPTLPNQTRKIVHCDQLGMVKKMAIVGQAGKLLRWRRRSHQWLLEFKWKWQKPWKLSEWIRHSDETIMRARPRPRPRLQTLSDML